MLQSLNGHWRGSRRTQKHPALHLKKPVLSGRTAFGLSQVLCCIFQVSNIVITLLSLVLIWWLIFLQTFLIFWSSGQLFLPLQLSVSPPSISGFMFLAEGQEQVGTLALHSTNVTYHDACVCSVCYMPQLQDWNETNHRNMLFMFYFIFCYTLTNRPHNVQWI